MIPDKVVPSVPGTLQSDALSGTLAKREMERKRT